MIQILFVLIGLVGAISFPFLLIAKLFGANIKWVWVLCPLWIPIVLAIVGIVAIVVVSGAIMAWAAVLLLVLSLA